MFCNEWIYIQKIKKYDSMIFFQSHHWTNYFYKTFCFAILYNIIGHFYVESSLLYVGKTRKYWIFSIMYRYWEHNLKSTDPPTIPTNPRLLEMIGFTRCLVTTICSTFETVTFVRSLFFVEEDLCYIYI